MSKIESPVDALRDILAELIAYRVSSVPTLPSVLRFAGRLENMVARGLAAHYRNMSPLPSWSETSRIPPASIALEPAKREEGGRRAPMILRRADELQVGDRLQSLIGPVDVLEPPIVVEDIAYWTGAFKGGRRHAFRAVYNEQFLLAGAPTIAELQESGHLEPAPRLVVLDEAHLELRAEVEAAAKGLRTAARDASETPAEPCSCSESGTFNGAGCPLCSDVSANIDVDAPAPGKFEGFASDLDALCRRHGVRLYAGVDGVIFAGDLATGEQAIGDGDLADATRST